MHTVAVPALTAAPRFRTRTALVASADRNFRQRISEILTGLRWKVREVESGAEAWAEAEGSAPEAIIVDSWFPDLDLGEFLTDFRVSFPQVDLVTTGSFPVQESPRGPYRQELLYALRRSQDTDTAAWNTAPSLDTPNSGPEEAEPKTHSLASMEFRYPPRNRRLRFRRSKFRQSWSGWRLPRQDRCGSSRPSPEALRRETYRPSAAGYPN